MCGNFEIREVAFAFRAASSAPAIVFARPVVSRADGCAGDLFHYVDSGCTLSFHVVCCLSSISALHEGQVGSHDSNVAGAGDSRCFLRMGVVVMCVPHREEGDGT